MTYRYKAINIKIINHFHKKLFRMVSFFVTSQYEFYLQVQSARIDQATLTKSCWGESNYSNKVITLWVQRLIDIKQTRRRE
jgi:hypothetical protein